jgi:hypothetical protein
MTTPVGGYAPGTNDVPGMQGGRDSTNGGHRNVAFLDAGACSKMLRALPSATSFFRNVRKAVSGLQTQSASNTSAIKNLLHSQANLNDQTNQLNYWMRQVSPQMDKLNSELVASNDALAALPDSSSNNVDAPGMPDSVTLLPSLTVDNLLLYFARPSYAGSTAVTGYELVTFTTAGYALAFSNGSAAVQLTESALAAAVGAAPWNTAQADEFYSVYGDELRFVSSGLVTGGAGQGLCVRLRAYNTSGANGANLYSEWSAPTLLVCAAASTAALKPKVEAIMAGVSYSLIEWSAPAVRQPDGSVARVGGIHSYMVGGTAVIGSSTIAQVPLASGTTSVTVGACSTADGSSPIATSDAFAVTVPTVVPRPSMTIQLIPSGTGVYASIRMNVTDYYSTTPIRYTVNGVDSTNNAYSGTATATSADSALSAEGSLVTLVRFPTSGNLQSSSTYSFTAVAEHATGSAYTSGPAAAQQVTTPAGLLFGVGEPLTNIYGSKYDNNKVVYTRKDVQGGSDSNVVYVISKTSGSWPTVSGAGVQLLTTSSVDPFTVTINDNASMLAWCRNISTIAVYAPSGGSAAPLTSSAWVYNPYTTMTLSSTNGGQYPSMLAFSAYDPNVGTSAQQMTIVRDPLGASTVIVPTVLGYSPDETHSYVHTCWGGIGASQYLAATTSDGELHIWPVDASTGSVGAAQRLSGFFNIGNSGLAQKDSHRLAINANGDTIVVLDGSAGNLCTATLSGGTWSAVTPQNVPSNYWNNVNRPFQLDAAGTRFMAVQYVLFNSGATKSSVWIRSGNTWTENPYLNSSAGTNNEFTNYMTPDGLTSLSYDAGTNVFSAASIVI